MIGLIRSNGRCDADKAHIYRERKHFLKIHNYNQGISLFI